MEIYGAQGRSIDYVQFKNILFNPFALWDFGKIDAVIRGSAQQSPRKLDTTFSNQVGLCNFFIFCLLLCFFLCVCIELKLEPPVL